MRTTDMQNAPDAPGDSGITLDAVTPMATHTDSVTATSVESTKTECCAIAAKSQP